MSDSAPIYRELEALGKIQVELTSVAKRSDERRRHDLVQLRRRLSDQLARVDEAVKAFLLANAPDLAPTYRSAFSRMRSALALHQATWPAVRIDEAPEEYRASLGRAHAANLEWVAWIRDNVPRVERGG